MPAASSEPGVAIAAAKSQGFSVPGLRNAGRNRRVSFLLVAFLGLQFLEWRLFVGQGKPSNQLTKSRNARMLQRFFWTVVFDGRTERSFGLRGFLMSYEIPMYAKKLPPCLDASDFHRKSRKKIQVSSFKGDFKGVCILTSDVRTSLTTADPFFCPIFASGTGVFAEKRFRPSV